MKRYSLVNPPSITTTIPKKNPFLSSDWKFWTTRFWKCLLKPCDPQQWEKPVQEMLTHYSTFLRYDKEGHIFLKKGTKLYHASTHYPFMPGSEKARNKITFFGLDAVISLWYILEETLSQKNDQCFQEPSKQISMEGYLYEFILKEDLEITTIIPTLTKNPKNDRNCKKNPKAVCLHPQISFHGGDGVNTPEPPNLFDLCNEITLRYQVHRATLGEPVHIYSVDPFHLHQHSNDQHYHPFQSIRHKITKKQQTLISCQQYNKKMSRKKEIV